MQQPDLPEGLTFHDGSFWFDCYACGKPTIWETEPEDFDITDRSNMCGRSERCIP